jgi:hypothetical protein
MNTEEFMENKNDINERCLWTYKNNYRNQKSPAKFIEMINDSQI